MSAAPASVPACPLPHSQTMIARRVIVLVATPPRVGPGRQSAPPRLARSPLAEATNAPNREYYNTTCSIVVL